MANLMNTWNIFSIHFSFHALSRLLQKWESERHFGGLLGTLLMHFFKTRDCLPHNI